MTDEKKNIDVINSPETLHIKYVPIESIKPYERNNKLHPKSQIELIKKSINTFGFRKESPIQVTSDMVIVAGHGRRLAAIDLGLKEVPIAIITDLEADLIRAYRIADNKVAESDFDFGEIKFELTELKQTVTDLTITGFTDHEISLIMGSDENGNDSNIYAKKIKAPIYLPSGDKPTMTDVVDTHKMSDLMEKIKAADISPEDKEFLCLAAQRFIVFRYDKIADYYSNSDKKVQDLMEKLALVIIDYDKAIENGFIKLSIDLAKNFATEVSK